MRVGVLIGRIRDVDGAPSSRRNVNGNKIVLFSYRRMSHPNY